MNPCDTGMCRPESCKEKDCLKVDREFYNINYMAQSVQIGKKFQATATRNFNCLIKGGVISWRGSEYKINENFSLMSRVRGCKEFSFCTSLPVGVFLSVILLLGEAKDDSKKEGGQGE